MAEWDWRSCSIRPDGRVTFGEFRSDSAGFGRQIFTETFPRFRRAEPRRRMDRRPRFGRKRCGQHNTCHPASARTGQFCMSSWRTRATRRRSRTTRRAGNVTAVAAPAGTTPSPRNAPPTGRTGDTCHHRTLWNELAAEKTRGTAARVRIREKPTDSPTEASILTDTSRNRHIGE